MIRICSYQTEGLFHILLVYAKVLIDQEILQTSAKKSCVHDFQGPVSCCTSKVAAGGFAWSVTLLGTLTVYGLNREADVQCSVIHRAVVTKR